MFWKRRKLFSYTCSCCGERFSGSPSFKAGAPPFIPDVPDPEFEGRIYVDDDLCHIRKTAGAISDDDIFAIRVTLSIPIHDARDPFCWSVWVTQSKDNFLRYVETAGSDQSSITTFGWMPVILPFYRQALQDEPVENLACDVRWQREGLRPEIVLHECDHPLYQDQRDGISWERAVWIARTQMERLHKVQ